MQEFLKLLIPSIIPVITGLCSGIVSYKMAVKQYTVELQKVREQNELELKKIREQSQFELKKIKLESEEELKKVKLELEQQAELYSKNAQTDAMNSIMTQFMGKLLTNPKGMVKQLKELEEVSKLMQK